MTAQLQDLIKQVGTDVSGKWLSVDNANILAELIVQKCCAIADEVERADVPVVASKFIKAHFGIEE
jgi:hypothetical protein